MLKYCAKLERVNKVKEGDIRGDCVGDDLERYERH